VAVTGDISSDNFVDSLIADVIRFFGRLNYCINYAGILGNSQSSTEASADDFDRIHNVNYRGYWFSSRAELRALLKQELLVSHSRKNLNQRGSVVNIASQLALVSHPTARESYS
jgi:NAD(P)-dependent dehydrogenase (short-subunit alcohol dehydrogenase family)